MPFQLVTMEIVNGGNAVSQRRSIILNMGFRRVLIPLAGALTETVAFAGSLLLLALMMVVYDIGPTAAVAWLPA